MYKPYLLKMYVDEKVTDEESLDDAYAEAKEDFHYYKDRLYAMALEGANQDNNAAMEEFEFDFDAYISLMWDAIAKITVYTNMVNDVKCFDNSRVKKSWEKEKRKLEKKEAKKNSKNEQVNNDDAVS